MPKQPGAMYVLKQLALNVRAARVEEERWQALGIRCHDEAALRQVEIQRDECEQVQDAALDYLIEQMDANERAQDQWALLALKREPSFNELKVRPIRQTKTPSVAPLSA